MDPFLIASALDAHLMLSTCLAPRRGAVKVRADQRGSEGRPCPRIWLFRASGRRRRGSVAGLTTAIRLSEAPLAPA